MEPAMTKHFGGLLRVMPIAEHGVRAAVDDLAYSTRRNRLVVVIDDDRFDIAGRTPSRAGLADLVLRGEYGRQWGHLGLSVEVEQPDARQPTAQFLEHRHRHNRGTVVALGKRGEV